MTLSDRDIRIALKKGEFKLKPMPISGAIGPASIDLRLSPNFKIFNSQRIHVLDTREAIPTDYMVPIKVRTGENIVIHPGDFILASTLEYMKVPSNMVLRVEGKSTLARMGILIHTAGFVDPGFEGAITLEISNQSNIPVALYPKMYICQIAVEYVSSPAQLPYNKRKKSAYNKSKGPVQANPKNLF